MRTRAHGGTNHAQPEGVGNAQSKREPNKNDLPNDTKQVVGEPRGPDWTPKDPRGTRLQRGPLKDLGRGKKQGALLPGGSKIERRLVFPKRKRRPWGVRPWLLRKLPKRRLSKSTVGGGSGALKKGDCPGDAQPPFELKREAGLWADLEQELHRHRRINRTSATDRKESCF